MAKKSFKPDYNACIGNNKHENFGSIYESMVKSEQFKALSSPARMLYVLCRITLYGVYTLSIYTIWYIFLKG